MTASLTINKPNSVSSVAVYGLLDLCQRIERYEHDRPLLVRRPLIQPVGQSLGVRGGGHTGLGESTVAGRVQRGHRHEQLGAPVRARCGRPLRDQVRLGSSAVRNAISVLPVPHAETMWPREPGLFRPRTPLSTAAR